MRAIDSRILITTLLVCTLACLTACGGSGANVTTCPGCNPPPVPNSFLMAAAETNGQSGQLLSFPINASTGALGTPLMIASPVPPFMGLAVAGPGPFLYATPTGPPTAGLVYGYQIDPTTGALMQLASSPYDSPNTITFNAPNEAGVGMNGSLYLAADCQFPSGQMASVVALSVGSDGSLSPSISGTPFAVAPAATDAGATGIAGQASFLYVSVFTGTSSTGGSIGAYAVDNTTGVLTSVPGSPFSVGPYAGPFDVVYDPLGFVYVTLANTQETEGYVQGFAVNSSTGALTALPGGPTSVSGYFWPVLDSSGQFLFSGTTGSQIEEFQVDSSTGNLTAVTGASAPVFPPLVVYGETLYAPTASLYGGNGEPPSIAAFSIDESTGALTPISGSPFLAAGSPIVTMTVATVPQ
jgi:6-phosphogluconolactonase (cycloisomerase 2 family)